jgi:transposase
LLIDRVERLMTIPAVGPITALTWALEVGDAKRFSSIKKAISYCGLRALCPVRVISRIWTSTESQN